MKTVVSIAQRITDKEMNGNIKTVIFVFSLLHCTEVHTLLTYPVTLWFIVYSRVWWTTTRTKGSYSVIELLYISNPVLWHLCHWWKWITQFCNETFPFTLWIQVCVSRKYLVQWSPYWSNSCFTDFVFKIRLIRLGFSFQKQRILYLNPKPTDSQSGVLTTTSQSQLWVGDTEKLSVTFSHAWLILVEFT